MKILKLSDVQVKEIAEKIQEAARVNTDHAAVLAMAGRMADEYNKENNLFWGRNADGSLRTGEEAEQE